MRNAKKGILVKIVFLALLGLASVVASQAKSSDEASARDQQLIAASERGDVAEVRTLLAQGASIGAKDVRGRTALMAATHANQIETAAVLIAAGADVNARDNIKDSPYLYAGAEGRHLESVRELLKTKIDVNHVNNYGWTALLEVCLKHRGPVYIDIVRVLLAGGANPNLADKEGVTPLAHAESTGNVEIVKLLKAAGGR